MNRHSYRLKIFALIVAHLICCYLADFPVYHCNVKMKTAKTHTLTHSPAVHPSNAHANAN